MSFQTNLNVNPYYDDYKEHSVENPEYYQVLFRPGFAVQARELTTLQTILSKQIERFGRHMFQEGSLVIPGNVSYNPKLDYITMDASLLEKGDQLIETGTGVEAVVISIVGSQDFAVTGNADTVYLKYTKTATSGAKTFATGVNNITFIPEGGATVTGGVFSVGPGNDPKSLVGVVDGVYFIRGHFVKCSEHQLIIDQNFTGTVGFNVIETLVTPESAIPGSEITDNATGSSNYGSKGAHRLSIELSLAVKLPADTTENFIELITLKNGILQTKISESKYSFLGDALAKRTYDESGNYTVDEFSIEVNEHLDNGSNLGTYLQSDGGDKDKAVIKIGPGKAYIEGYKLAKNSPTIIDVEKANIPTTILDVGIHGGGGDYFEVKSICFENPLTQTGGLNLDKFGMVRLYNKEIGDAFGFGVGSSAHYNGTPIGIGRLRGVDGTAGDRTKVHLTDIQMDTHIKVDVTGNNSDHLTLAPLLTGQKIIGKSSGAYGYIWTTVWGSDSGITYEKFQILDITGEFVLGESVTFSNIDRISAINSLDPDSIDNATIYSINKESPSSVKMVEFLIGGNSTADIALDDEKVLSGTLTLETNISGAATNQAISNNETYIKGTGTKFITELRPWDIIYSAGIRHRIREVISDTQLTLQSTRLQGGNPVDTHEYTTDYEAFAGINVPATRVRGKLFNNGDESLIYKLPKSNISNTGSQYIATHKRFITSDNAGTGQVTFTDASIGSMNYNWDNSNFTLFKKRITNNETIPGSIDSWVTVPTSEDLWFTPTISGDVATFSHSSISGGDIFLLHIAETASQGANVRGTMEERFNEKIIIGETQHPHIHYGRDYRDDRIALIKEDNSEQYSRVFKIKAIYQYNKNLPEADVQPKITMDTTFSVGSGDIISCVLSGAIGTVTGEVINGSYLNYHPTKGTFATGDAVRILKISDGTLSNHNITGVVLPADGVDVIDVTDSYLLDTGQRSSMVGVSSIIRKKSEPAPLDDRKMMVIFDHFVSSGSTGPITANSYQYNTVSTIDPVFTTSTVSQGYEPVDAYLKDCIDFRPTLTSPTNSNPFHSLYRTVDGNVFSLPEPNTTITLGSLDHNLPRIDALYLNRYGEFKIMTGISSEETVVPEVISGSMKIADIFYPPQTNSTTYKDIQISKIANQRYTMSDIRKLDNRIDNLEYYVSLNQLEASAANMDIRDEFGFNKFKSGFVVDNFKGHTVGDVTHPDYSCAIDKKNNILRPEGNIESANLILDSVPTGLVLTGDVLSLYFDTETLVSQGMATKTVNVNPFNIISWVGNMKLSPETDTWIDTITAPEIILNREGNYETLKSENNIGTIWESWKELWVGEETLKSKTAWWSRQWSELNPANGWMMSGHHVKSIFSQTTRMHREGLKTELIESFEKKLVGTKVINSSIIPYMRKNDIKVDIIGMKANTRFYPFFDGVSVIESMSKEQTADPLLPPLVPIIPSTQATELKTDTKGSWSGYFTVPTGTKKFTTGKKILRFTDSDINAYDATVDTAAEATYEASGVLNTEESTFLSIRNGEIVKSTVLEGKDVISLRESEIVDAYRDPLAQTFEVKKDGGTFLTSIDLFFQTKDNMELPVTVMIRSVDNGYPGKIILPFSKVSKDPGDVNVSENGELETTFVFDGPVYLKDKSEYCIVIESASNKYECFVSEIGEKDLISTSYIQDQPHLGSFFMSQNSSTWTAEQMMDLKFTLNCAVFQTNNPVTAELKSDLLKLKSDKASSSDTEETVKLGDNPFRVIDKSLTLPILRVYHPNHGYITGNNVTINGAIAQGSLDHINGTYSIGKYETDYYQITGTNALINVLPLKDSNFGGSSVTVGKKLPCDILHPIVSIMDFDETTISTGLSGSEVQLNSDIVLSERKYISPANISNPKFNVTLGTTNPNISPIIDTARMSLLAISNRVDSISKMIDIIDEDNYNDSTASDGDSNSSIYITKKINLNNPAESIKVFIDASVPTSNANIEIYYKTLVETSGQSQFDDLSWVPFNNNGSSDSGIPAGGGSEFIEYEYSIENLNPFNSFAIKVVMKSTDTSRPPLIKNFRAIALA